MGTNKRTSDQLTMPVWPDAARALGLGRNATYEAIARGDIPSVRIGKRILVPVKALERLLAGGKAA